MAAAVALPLLYSTCVASSDSVRAPLTWTAEVVPSQSQGDTCATLTGGVRVRIERLKALTRDWTAKIRDGQGHDTSDKMRDERRTIKDLNTMLQGIGCEPLDIEHELAQPPRTISQPPTAKLKFGKHRHNG